MGLYLVNGESGKEGERGRGREGEREGEMMKLEHVMRNQTAKNYMYIILYAPDNINMANLNMLFVATHTHTHMHTHTHTHTGQSHTGQSHTWSS